MKRKGLNLVFAFLISSCIHALAIGFVVYTIFGNDDNTNISKDKGERLAFGISFAQISDINTDSEAAAKSQEISNTTEDLRHPVEEVYEEVVFEDKLEEIIEQKVDEEQFKQDIKPKPKEKIKKPEKKKPVKPEKIVEKKHICENCAKPEKTADETTEKSFAKSSAGSNMQADNDVNAIGGSKSSGSAINEQVGGSNLSGEIYAALKKHMTYPKRALERKIEGRVVLEFRQIDEKKFEYIKVTESSGYRILDMHAIKIVNSAARSLPKESHNLVITVPISFDINNF